MNDIDKYDRHEQLCKQLNQTYRAKNVAYGDSFGRQYKKYGNLSALIRLEDKWNRIEALMKGAENKVVDERLEDTLIDMACYCLMTVLEMEVAEEYEYEAVEEIPYRTAT